MYKNRSYAYDRVQLEEVSSDEEFKSPVGRSRPHHPFPERRKHAVRTHQPQTRCCCQNPLCIKCIYLFMVGLVMVAGMLVVLNIINPNSTPEKHTHLSHKEPVVLTSPTNNVSPTSTSNFCTKLEVQQIWVQNFPKLLTETAVRLLDVNQDGILDAILGFATGAAGPFADPDLLCKIYFSGQVPCFGGVLALDGSTGNEIWRHWSEQEVFALNCNADINGDGISDCICSGRMGMFELISGSDGKRIWVFDHHSSKVSISNFYTAQFIHDVDGDDVQDVLTIHGGDPLREPGATVNYAGRLMLFSGKTGQVVTWSLVPDGMESYYSPQVYFDSNRDKVVLFGTGGETHGGALWVIKLNDFIDGKMKKARCLYKDIYKGVMTPPVLLDLTGDGVLDIVIATFNSTVLAINGENYNMLWNFSMPMSETYATPAPGFFNEDNVPDFLVIFNHGPTYPVYYYSEVTVLDGRTGQPLVQPFIRHSGSIQSSPLTVSTEGTGKDVFLYFASDCLNHEGKSAKFSFTKSTYQSSKSRADFCKVRFNTTSFSRLYAISYSTGSPGSIIYDSLNHKSEEYTHSVNTSLLAQKFLEMYPGTAQYVMDRQREFNEGPKENLPTNLPGNKYKDKEKNNDYITNTFSQLDNAEYLHSYDSSSLLETYFYNEQNFKDVKGDDEKNEKKYDSHTDEPPSNKKSGEKHKILQLLKNMFEEPKNSDHSSNETDNNDRIHSETRRRRHAGPHDSGGLQRLIATGTLTPSLRNNNYQGIDLIFPVYWFYPAETEILTEEQQKCVDLKMETEGARMNPDSKYYGMDHDAYDRAVEDECKGNETDSIGRTENLIRTNPLQMYPFNLHMGEMTVYRLQLSCACVKPPCTRILPFRQQAWPSYLGARANSIYVRRRGFRKNDRVNNG